MDQEIKKEPLGDEERPMELLDHDYCLLKPKLEEIDSIIEPKLEEPEYFHTEQPEIKLEPVESLEVVKQELLVPKTEKLDHFHTEQPDFEFEPLELKLENPEYSEMDCSFEYSAEESSTEPDEPEMNSPSNSKDLNIIRSKRNLRTYKCQLCSSLESNDRIAHLCSYERKLVLLVALICAGKKTEEALQLITRRTIIICKIHLSETVVEIYKTLNIKNIHEIDSCSEENKQKLMSVVNMLCGEMNFNQFVENVLNFLKTADHSSKVKMNMPSFSSAVLKKPQWTVMDNRQRSRCFVCSLLQIERELTIVESRGRRLALMVGCVLGGKKTVEEAHLMLSKKRIFICRRHLSEAAKEIFKAVNIKKVDEMQSCSMENKEKLMNTVNSLSPSVSFLEFCSISRHFCLISKH